MQAITSFTRVSEMNTAFGNPKGDPHAINVPKLRSQTRNILDEYCELQIALGADPEAVAVIKKLGKDLKYVTDEINLKDTRDALCDVHVFAYGAHHFMGIDANVDMNAVVDGVMTRFVKDEDDKQATIALHAGKGVTDVYFEGQFPKMIMKSASDQPDAPKGKFLKSASYKDTVFPSV
jgi:predicted HAD superfamily Cof-like phosphohydrolase